MKAIYPVIILIGALSSLAPSIHIPLGTPEVAIHGVGQNLNYATISTRTNTVRGVTNIVQALKSTTTNITINTDSLFAMLENSFNTNFPAGCRLLLAGQGGYFVFVVSDATGTNAGFYPNQVLSSSFLTGGLPIVSGAETETFTNISSILSGKDAESFGAVINFTYDDTAMTNTTDGTHTKFTWVGLMHDKSVATLPSAGWFYNDTVSMEVIGSGLIRFPTNVVFDDVNMSVFTGSIRAKVSGL